MANNYLNVEVWSNYGYISKDSISAIETNFLEYESYFSSLDWADSNLEHIAESLEETGKLFAKNQGFQENESIITLPDGRYRINTGDLVRGIHAKVDGQIGRFKAVRFWNDANHRGEYYAAHMEYGFHDRGGNFIPARPFMRPALYAVAEGSKQGFEDTIESLLLNMWQNNSYRGISSLEFAKPTKNSGTALWKNSKNFAYLLSQRNSFSKLKDTSNLNKRLSLMNPHNKNAITRKKGFSIKKNKEDYKKLKVPLRQRKSYVKQKKLSKKTKKSKEDKKVKTKEEKTKEEKQQTSSKLTILSKPKKGKSLKAPSKPTFKKPEVKNKKNKKKKILFSTVPRW